jgi:hypothetical protein
MYDFLSSALLYQDSGATVPVTSPSDPIGYGLDLSGNGFHFLPSSTGARPSWSSAGAQFDGVNHWAVMTFGPTTPGVGWSFLGARCNYTTGTGHAGIVAVGQSPNASDFRMHSTVGKQYGNGNGVDTPASSSIGLHTLSVESAGGAANGLAYIDGAPYVLTNPGAGINHTQKKYICIGCQTVAGGNRANILVKRVFIINANLSADEKDKVREWLGKMG